MAAPTATYKRILQLLDKWPVDSSKSGGRDLGEHLRVFINRAYKENKFEAHPKYWDRQYLSLKRLLDNEHKNKYKRSLSSTATGLTKEECHTILSNEVLEELEKEEKSYFRKFVFWVPDAERYAEENAAHIPVMAVEAVEYLKPKTGEVIIDMTFGAGGHSRQILEKTQDVKLFCLDRDPVAYSYAKKLAEKYPNQVIPLNGKFSDLPVLLSEHGIKQNCVDSILFDYGCSSMQFDEGHRGFSISKDGPLDMRMDGNKDPESLTAADVLATAVEEDLYKIIKYYGEEKQARKIARAIVDARHNYKNLTTTQELASVIDCVCMGDIRKDKLDRHSHTATKTFQALRIFVNNELNEINYGLILAHHYLKIGGRLVTITFHSLEDTIVKRHLTGNVVENSANVLPLKYCNQGMAFSEELINEVMDPKWKMLHKHVILPKYDEVEANPRSRSAKLRAAVKLKH